MASEEPQMGPKPALPTLLPPVYWPEGDERAAADGSRESLAALVDAHLCAVMPQVQDFTRKLLAASLHAAQPPRPLSDATAAEPVVVAQTLGSLRRLDSPSPAAPSALGNAGLAGAVVGNDEAAVADEGPHSDHANAMKATHDHGSMVFGDMPVLTDVPDHGHLQLAACDESDSEASEDAAIDAAFELLCGGCRRHRRLIANLMQFTKWFKHLEEPDRTKSVLFKFVYGHFYEMLCASVILVNSVEAAYAADYEMKNLGDDPPMFVQNSEKVFLVFYSIELVLKTLVHRQYFLINKDWTWNCFDCMLIVQSVYEYIAAIFVSGGGGGSKSFMRTLRLMKIGKAFRALKFFRIFSELKLLTTSLKNSFAAVFWTVIMLIFIFYVFGLIAMQGIATFINEGTGSQQEVDGMLESFGSMSSAMITMYATGTDGWIDYYNMIAHTGPVYVFSYLSFTAFFYIAVFNVVTGMVVDKVMKLAEPDHDAFAKEWKVQQRQSAKEVKQLCHTIDKDGSGKISWEEFESMIHDDRVRAYFAMLDLEVKHAEQFFLTLSDMADSRDVGIDYFVEGCMMLKGGATSIDLHMLSVQMRVVERHQKEFFAYCIRGFESTGLAVNELRFAAPMLGSSLPMPKLSPRVPPSEDDSGFKI